MAHTSSLNTLITDRLIFIHMCFPRTSVLPSQKKSLDWAMHVGKKNIEFIVNITNASLLNQPTARTTQESTYWFRRVRTYWFRNPMKTIYNTNNLFKQTTAINFIFWGMKSTHISCIIHDFVITAPQRGQVNSVGGEMSVWQSPHFDLEQQCWYYVKHILRPTNQISDGISFRMRIK